MEVSLKDFLAFPLQLLNFSSCRYVKGLHKDIKKGRWDTEEKDKLIELTAKYGVGEFLFLIIQPVHTCAVSCRIMLALQDMEK